MKRKCERAKISQTACNRVAKVVRVTTAGKLVALCATCDALFGDVVGEKMTEHQAKNVYHVLS